MLDRRCNNGVICGLKSGTLVIRDFIPQNIIDIRPQDLLKFREKYRDERQRFILAIRDAAMVISECEDETVYNDRLEDLKKEIESSLTDYRGNMEALNIAGLSRQQLLSHPCATTRFNIEIP